MNETQLSPLIDEILQGLSELAKSRSGSPGLPSTLTAAALKGDLAMIDLFLEQGAPLDEKTFGFRSPLAAAASAGQLAAVSRLLAAGASPRSREAASAAAKRNRIDILEQLFAAGLDPGNAEAVRALEWAAILGQAEGYRWLLARGVKVKPISLAFVSAEAERNGHEALAAHLRGEPVDLATVATARQPPILTFGTVDEGERRRFRANLEAKALEELRNGGLDSRTERTDHFGRSLLTAALEEGFPELALALLDDGANPSWGGREADPPLLAAASHGQLATLRALLAQGVDPDARSQGGETALMRAAEYGIPEAVETLLAAKADPKARDAPGRTAMSFASGPYRNEIRRQLRLAASRLPRAKRPPALSSTGRPTEATLAPGGGVRDFVTFFEARHPEWSVLAVKAPIDRVTPTLASLRAALSFHTDVARPGVDEATSGVFVVQFAGHPWTLELRALGWKDWPDGNDLDRQAAQLSRELDAEVVTFLGSDASVSHAIVRFRGGERREALDSETTEGSKLIEALCRELAFRAPPCAYAGDGFHAQLALHRLKASAVERLDYLVLRE